MKTIYDNNTRTELTRRIGNLTGGSKAQWGKMNAYQMLKHCTLSEELYLGKKKYDRLFIGRLFGKMALGGIVKDEQPMKHGLPTHPDFKITGTGNFEEQRNKWLSLLAEYNGYSAQDFVHPFFGKMTNEQIGQYVYKHTDHHLRQFNC